MCVAIYLGKLKADWAGLSAGLVMTVKVKQTNILKDGFQIERMDMCGLRCISHNIIVYPVMMIIHYFSFQQTPK